MGRWAPDARGRLERAALELYGEHGFDSTTVAEIAERAGLTERTFFRHFADKREVLFFGAAALQAFLVNEVDNAPASAGPLGVITSALDAAAAAFFEERRDFARQRQAIIAANAELQERELIKLAALSVALADALRRRGVSDPAASLAAEAGIAILRTAFGEWASGGGELALSEHIRAAADELRAVTAGDRTAG
ncbi:MAG TPA: TetR family transcriptional regulator [Streptosporangiaceae bacterium]|nr:TetR family transcriptional regulator [Streptosporangiaceae bacterium]